ncbi:MAG: hypothetical protein VXZ38_05785 [Planctomycetota bacterium]|nr:hypothetical protein [Planctomycetota bacterium]
MIRSSDSPDGRHQSPLLWSNPLLGSSERSNLILIISPYSHAAAVSKLFEDSKFSPGLQIITKWDSASLSSGASDPKLFPLLERHGGRLYTHPRIHLKLYIHSKAEAILSTGNLTFRGLGLCDQPNIETSATVSLSREDWNRINDLCRESTRITEAAYLAAKEYLKTNPPPSPERTFTLPPSSEPTETDYSWLSLPATPSPDWLWKFYSNPESFRDPDEKARGFHDLNLYDIHANLSSEAFHQQTRDAFLSHPFISKLIGWLTEKGNARFGMVKEWIQSNCSDKPTPYRCELTPATQALFDWLAFCHPSVSWDRPNHAQVLHWNEHPN